MANTQIKIGCVVMAAGSASRFGENKLAASAGGKTLIARALDAVPADMLEAVCVVTRFREFCEEAALRGYRWVWNGRPEDGISRTIRLGTDALAGTCDAIVYQVADQPHLKRESVAALVELYRAHPGSIAALAHHGVRGNPCIFPRDLYPELCALTGDTGGAAVIKRHPDRLLLLEADADELFDVDTPEALQTISFSRTACSQAAGCTAAPRRTGNKRPRWRAPWGST